jgi:hypothetical protein
MLMHWIFIWQPPIRYFTIFMSPLVDLLPIQVDRLVVILVMLDPLDLNLIPVVRMANLRVESRIGVGESIHLCIW